MSVNEAIDVTGNEKKQRAGYLNSTTLKRFAPLLAILVLLGVGYAFGLHNYMSLEALNQNKTAIDTFVSDHLLLAMGAYLAIYIVAVSLSFPGASFLTLAGGAIFGWAIGGTLTVIGATVGAAIIFLVAKTSIGDYLAEKAGPRMNALRDGFQKDAFNYLLTLRLAPVVPFWITNLAPALFGMDVFRYTLATFIGIIPGTYAYSFIGQQLGSAVDGSDITQKVALGLGALALASVIPLVVKRIRGRKQAA